MPSSTEQFYAVGYTRNDILNGGNFRLIALTSVLFGRMRELTEQYGSLDRALRAGKVTREDVEVLLYDPLLFGDGKFGENYEAVYFFNAEAYRLCVEFNIAVPKLIRQITRKELPDSNQLGTLLRSLSYRRVH